MGSRMSCVGGACALRSIIPFRERVARVEGDGSRSMLWEVQGVGTEAYKIRLGVPVGSQDCFEISSLLFYFHSSYLVYKAHSSYTIPWPGIYFSQ